MNQPRRGSFHEELFGPYRLEALLGRGGMGEVFRAYDTEYERVVAVKRLPAHLADDAEFRARFKQEARLAAGLRNPHIIPIHRFGEFDGSLFIDMRYVEGFDISDLVKAIGPVSPERAVTIIEQAASALDTAHAAGLVHRDVKPSNLLIDREAGESIGDYVYLVDFGLTRADSTTRSHSLTRTGALLGSLDYMAPEQFDGVIDKRADIYALTCVLVEMITGKKPFHATGLPALMHAHLHVAPPVLSQIRPDLGTAFDEVISRGMAKRREERFESSGELAAAARKALGAAGQPSAAATGIGLDKAAACRSRAAEYDYVTQYKEREHIESAARHALIEDGSGTHSPPALVPVPSSLPEEADASVANGPVANASGKEPASLFVPAGDVEARSAADSVTEIVADTENHEAAPGEDADPGPDRGRPRPESVDDQDADAAAAPSAAPQPTNGAASAPGTGGGRGAPVDWRWRLAAVAVLGVLAVGVGAVVTLSEGDRTGATVPAPPEPIAAGPTEPVAPAGATGPTVRAVVPVGQAPQGLAVSPNGGPVFVANIDSRTVSMIDQDGAAVSASLPMPGTPRYVAVSPDGRRAYVSMYSGRGADSAVAVVDVAGGSVSAEVPSSPEPYALAAAPTGDVFVPSHGSSSVSVLDGQTLQFSASVTVEPNPHGVAFSPSGARAYSANHESDSISVIDVASNTVVATVGVGASPHSLAVSPDGRLVAVANYDDGTINLVETITNQVTVTLPGGPTPQHLTFSADGRFLYVVNEDTDAVTTVDVAAGAVVATTPVGRSPRFIVATPDGTTLYVSNSIDGTVSVLSTS